jgi:methyl-accepting chemotaxis protein
MTIGKRLYLLILSMMLGLGAVAGIGIYQMNKVYTAASYATINTVPSILTIDEFQDSITQLRIKTWQHIETKSLEKKNEIEKSMAVDHEKIIHAFDKYEKEDISDDKDRNFLTEERNGLSEYDVLRKKVLTLSDAGKDDDASEVLLGNQAPIVKLVDAIRQHLNYNALLGNTGAETAAVTMKNSNKWVIFIALLTTMSIACMGLLIIRKIVRSFTDAVRVAQTVAAGNLSSRIEVTSKDETGQLMQALKDMNGNLMKIVSEVRIGTETIGTASSQIAAGNLDLSSRTEQQASSLEETASAMEQITSTVKQNADNAQQATAMAVSASEMATKGGGVVGEVISTMNAINASSSKIVDIISVIDAIAFQTNILALNAAVEAARAGEQGRGFAVVASEVRNLAQRSAVAAKEIKMLIADSVEKVGQGSRLVEQAGITMSEVVDSVKRVTDIVSEISAASQEQSIGIEEVNRAITQMDEVTQQNAALVEEAAAASESLHDQARNLAKVVSVFNLGNTQVDRHNTAHGNRPVPRAVNSPPKMTRIAPARSSRKMMPAAAGIIGSWEQF